MKEACSIDRGARIAARWECGEQIFTFLVDELSIGEVNVKTAGLQKVHTVLFEPAFNGRIWRLRRPVGQGCRRLRFPDVRCDHAPTAR